MPRAGSAEVSMLASGPAAALPLGQWVELRRKRPVMVAMDLTRFVAAVTYMSSALGIRAIGVIAVDRDRRARARPPY